MRQYRWLVAFIVVVCTALGVLYSVAKPRQYKATASVVIEDPRLNAIIGNANASSGNYVTDQVAIMQLPLVAQRATALVAQQVGAQISIDDYLKKLSVSNASNSGLVKVKFQDSKARVAQSGANATLQAYQTVARDNEQSRVTSTLANIDQALANLAPTAAQAVTPGSPTDQIRQQLLALRAQVVANSSGDDSGISALSSARLPTGLSGTSAIPLGVIGFVVGLLLSAGITYLISARRRKVRDRFDPALVLDTSLLGEITDFPGRTVLPARDRPRSVPAEAFRFTSSALAIRQLQTEAVIVAIVSGYGSAGKTTVAANLAITAAREGKNVLVIDGDLEGQAMSALLGADSGSRPGLVNLINGSAGLADALGSVPLDDRPGLSLLSRGSFASEGVELFGTLRSRRLFDEIRRHFDLVIIDTPSILEVAYSSKIAVEADLCVVVVQHGSSVTDLVDLADRLRFVGASLAGYVYNRAPGRRGLSRRSAKRAGPPAPQSDQKAGRRRETSPGTDSAKVARLQVP